MILSLNGAIAGWNRNWFCFHTLNATSLFSNLYMFRLLLVVLRSVPDLLLVVIHVKPVYNSCLFIACDPTVSKASNAKLGIHYELFDYSNMPYPIGMLESNSFSR
jgi:hypothetical protein